MRIKLLSVLVRNQDQALKFYTEILGFIKKTEIPLGEHRWLTVVPIDDQDGPEVVLEPMAFAPAAIYQEELFKAGIPSVTFEVDDIDQEYTRLLAKGVKFSVPPTLMGPVKMVVLDDTCGNHVQLLQMV